MNVVVPPAGRNLWKQNFSLRRFLSLLGLTGVAGAGVYGYARHVEPEWLQVLVREVPLRFPSGPLRLLQLSDFHAGEFVSLEYIERAIHQGLALQPDLACITGDLLNHRFPAIDQFAGLLRQLSRVVPTFATAGNHDGGAWATRWNGYPDTQVLQELLRKGGVEFLHNRAVRVDLGGSALNLVGLGDLWAQEFDPSTAFAGSRTADAAHTVVLSHNPDTKEKLLAHPWSLLLSGHTHGGQLRIPLFGAPFAPVQDRRYLAGLYRWEGRWLHVSKGVGNLHGLRFNCRPDITLLILR